MKLCTVSLEGNSRFGALVDRGFIDLSALFGARCKDLKDFLRLDLMAEASRYLPNAPAIPLEGLQFEPVIPNLEARMFALGWSYKDHQLETGKEAPLHPFIFSKHPQAMVGSGQPLVRPFVSEKFDYEGEVVIVIGKAGRHIPQELAMAHVAGYSIAIDGSIRDWQQHSVTAGKNFDRSSAYGPCLVTRDEMPDPKKMVLVTRLNGVEMQRSSYGLLQWETAQLVSYVSTICRLEPGDAISTGTPGGVGHKRKPPVFMKAGDLLEVEVSGIGTLSNTIIDEERPA